MLDNLIKILILKVLRASGPMHGYQIVDSVNKHAPEPVLYLGSVNPILWNMTIADLIKEDNDVEVADHGQRKYAIASAGEDYLKTTEAIFEAIDQSK